MSDSPILVPFFGMLLLTLVVWVFMYYHRLRLIREAKIDPQSLSIPEAAAAFPPRAVNPANNLKNLFELPVLFYALVLLLLQTGQVDSVYTLCACGFFVFRVVHSAIHCTYNRVMHRFSVYCISSVFLWVMVVRAALTAF